MSAERYYDTQQKRKRSRRKGSFAIILILMIVVAIAVGYNYVRKNGIDALNNLTFCGSVSTSDASASDASSADVSAADIAQPQKTASSSEAPAVSPADVSGSDAQSDPGFFGKVGQWFTSAKDWVSGVFGRIGGWFNRTFSGCARRSDSDAVSPTDGADRAVEEMQYWDIAGDDAQYTAMMQEKSDQIIDLITELRSLEDEMSEYTTPDAVRIDTRFISIRSRIENWCGAALAYPQEAIFSQQAQAEWQASQDLARAALAYLSAYPEIVTGKYAPADGELSGDQLLGSVTEYTVALYSAAHGLSIPAPVSGSDN